MFSQDKILERQPEIAEGTAEKLHLPKFSVYCICNLRGGIGKTSLVFNLSFLTDNLLAVDTCPQGNLSFFYNSNYFSTVTTNVYSMLLPYFRTYRKTPLSR